MMTLYNSIANLAMTCKKHPKYKAVREPRSHCTACILIWSTRRHFIDAARAEDYIRAKKARQA